MFTQLEPDTEALQECLRSNMGLPIVLSYSSALYLGGQDFYLLPEDRHGEEETTSKDSHN